MSPSPKSKKDFDPFHSSQAKAAFTKSAVTAGAAVILVPVLCYAAFFISIFASVGLSPHGQKPSPPALLSFIPLVLFGIAILAGPFVLAKALQSGMEKHRTLKGKLAGKTIAYATLWQRGWAMVIDGLVMLVPAAILAGALVFMLLLLWPLGGENKVPWQIFAGLFSFYPLAGLIRLLLALQEGKTGYTPGRLAMGIRLLNLNLKPCGFWRSLLRSVVMMADSFFQYTVGAYFIAYTRHQQRIGDMAAGTVVIQVGKGRA